MKSQISKLGKSYLSGAYTGAAKKISDIESSDNEDDVLTGAQVDPIQESSHSEKFIDTRDEYCVICLGTDANRIVGIGLSVVPDNEDIFWTRYDNCKNWYHLICIGMENEIITEDEDWKCVICD